MPRVCVIVFVLDLVSRWGSQAIRESWLQLACFTLQLFVAVPRRQTATVSRYYESNDLCRILMND